MKMKYLFAFLFFCLPGPLTYAQNTPWDIIYCLNGGENKSVGIGILPVPNPAEKSGWNLIFSDEFLTDTLKTKNWNRSTPGDDKYGECFRNFAINPANITVENGYAKIMNTLGSPMPGCPYSFGEIKTMSLKDTAFDSYYFNAPGYLETRVLLFNKTGQGAACWLWGLGTPENPGTSGPWNEIDVFEINGTNNNIFNGAYHWTDNNNHVSQNHSIYLTEAGQPYDLSANWTTFGLEWDSTAIRWYVNNLLVKELDLSKIPPFCINAPTYGNPISTFCVRFNTGYNTVGNQSAVASPEDFPNSMLIDYIRLYKKSGYKAVPILNDDKINQICATVTSPPSPDKTIRASRYPGTINTWTSDAFDLKTVALPIPQSPEKMIVSVKPGTQPDHTFPIIHETLFPSGYHEVDTLPLFIASAPPVQPSDDFVPEQIGSTCHFTLTHHPDKPITGCEYSLDNGITWLSGSVNNDNGSFSGRFGDFRPLQTITFSYREQNGCGLSPPSNSTVNIPAAPSGCSWPAGVNDPDNSGETSSDQSLSLSPNPVSDYLWVKIPTITTFNEHTIQLRIYNIWSGLVMTTEMSTNGIRLDLTRLPSGFYYLHIQLPDLIKYHATFVKN